MPSFNWWHGGSSDFRSGYLLSFDYDPALVNELKKRIPASMREWYPNRKLWWVSEHCEKVIDDLFPGFLEAVKAQQSLL